MATRYLMHFALLVTTFGTKEVLDANSFLQLVTESSAALNASGAEEVAPVEEIAKAEIDLLKERGEQETEVLKKIVEMKEMEVDEGGRESTLRGHAAGEGGAGNGSAIEMEGMKVGEEEEEEEARGIAERSTRAAEHVAHGRVLGGINRSSPWASSDVETLDLYLDDLAVYGFSGGFADGTYGYAIPTYHKPVRNQQTAYMSGKLRRFDLAGFATVEVLDLTVTDPDLKGFRGGFRDGVYGYVIPFAHSYGGAPTEIYLGKVARFDLAGFATVEVLDLTATDPDLKAFDGGFSDGTYGYAVPYNGRDAGLLSGKVARFDLASFATVKVLDLRAVDTRLQGFGGGFKDTTYGYILPLYRYTRGQVPRFDLASFSVTEVLNLEATDTELKGFFDGFHDGTYGYACPHVYGKAARFDLAGFTAVEVLDVRAFDSDLRTFRGCFSDGTYGYSIPKLWGKVGRFDLLGFTTIEALDLLATDSNLKPFERGFTDGIYGYAIPGVWPKPWVTKMVRFGVSTHDATGGGTDQTGGGTDQTSIVGDPHVVNVAEAKFKIHADGVHKLVQMPRFIHANGKPDLRVDGKIQHLAGTHCSKSFMTSLAIYGRWTEDAAGLMRITRGSDMPNTTLLVNTEGPEEYFRQFPLPGVRAGRASIAFKLRDVSFHVGKHYEGRYGKQQAYLNLRITGLKKYKDIGGLLGYDDHADAEKLAANCTAAQPAAAGQSSFIGTGRSVPVNDGGSRIEAE